MSAQQIAAYQTARAAAETLADARRYVHARMQQMLARHAAELTPVQEAYVRLGGVLSDVQFELDCTYYHPPLADPNQQAHQERARANLYLQAEREVARARDLVASLAAWLITIPRWCPPSSTQSEVQ